MQLPEPLFSVCKRIVGKDKTEVARQDGKGVVQKWTLYRNRFQNYTGETITESPDDGSIIKHLANSRDDIMKLVAHHGYATAYILKDDTLKVGRSREPNILGARHIMVDFDNTMSLEEAMSHPWWNKVSFAYTTPSYGQTQGPIDDQDRIKLPHSQLEAIEKQVGLPKRNFRLVFMFSRFVPPDELIDVAAGMMSIFPLADQSCIDVARLMFGTVKARVEKPSVEYKLTDDDLASLKKLGVEWRSENKKNTSARLREFSSTAQQAAGDFNGETVITLDTGEALTIREIMEQKQLGFHAACFSPFRNERSPSAFVKKFEDNGNVFVYDSGSGLKHTWRPEAPATLTFKRKQASLSSVEVPPPTTELLPIIPKVEHTQREEVTMVSLRKPMRGKAYDPEYTINLTLEERRAQIKEAASQLDRWNLFFAPEGFGKSFITAALSSRLRKILFCCATNEQAEQKAAEFSLLKLNTPGFPHLRKPSVQLCLSRDYLFKKATEVSVLKEDSIDPFAAPITSKSKTIEKLMEVRGISKKEAYEWYQNYHDDADVENPDFSETAGFSIIVTTMARAEILAKSGKYRGMSEDWVIVYDDPGQSDVSNLVPFSEAREARILAENERRTEQGLPDLFIIKREFNGRVYYVRPEECRLGQSFRPFSHEEGQREIVIPVMYTTTEELTKYMIEAVTPSIKVFDFMHATSVTNVTIWGTSLVHAKQDGLIILATELLQHDYPDEPISLIGDGLGQRLNHLNNKGQNNLAERHIIIELSQLHPVRRTQLVDEMAYLDKSTAFTDNDITTFYMRDQMHQAIGRNSGYREKEGAYQTVVLCDPHHWESLHDTCRYAPAPWSTQLDARVGDSARAKVNVKKRGINVFSYHDAMPQMIETLRTYVAHPNTIFEHPELVTAVRTVATQSPQTKKRVTEALMEKVKKNAEQTELLTKLVNLLA